MKKPYYESSTIMNIRGSIFIPSTVALGEYAEDDEYRSLES